MATVIPYGVEKMLLVANAPVTSNEFFIKFRVLYFLTTEFKA